MIVVHELFKFELAQEDAADRVPLCLEIWNALTHLLKGYCQLIDLG